MKDTAINASLIILPYVYIRRFIYKFLNVCPFDYTVVAGSGKVGPVNQVNHTSWVAVVTPTDRPKSVRNRCLIELFCGVVCVVTARFDISVGVGAFVIGLSQISSFLSLHKQRIYTLLLSSVSISSQSKLNFLVPYLSNR